MPVKKAPKEVKNYKPKQKVELNKPYKNFQKNVVANDSKKNRFSQFLILWDSMPKFFITRRKQSQIRSSYGTLEELTFEFKSGDKIGKVTMIPAYALRDGKRHEFFLSEEEEILEQILRKLFVQQQKQAFQEEDKDLVGVKFTLRQLARELKAVSKTRSIPQIKETLQNLRRASVRIKMKGFNFETSVISNLWWEGDELFDDTTDPNAMWEATFSFLVAKGIEAGDYRQYNIEDMMNIKSQLGRWIYRKISLEFTGCSVLINPRTKQINDEYKISLSTIDAESCMMLGQLLKQKNRMIKKALSELKEKGYIADFKVNTLFINDQSEIEYCIKVTADFVSEMKVSNKQVAEKQL